MGSAPARINVDGQAEYSRQENHALHLVDQIGVVYFELLQPGETITGDRYRLQLMRLSRALKEKRPETVERHDKGILQHDNARRMLLNLSKNTLERLAGKCYPTRRIVQT